MSIQTDNIQKLVERRQKARQLVLNRLPVSDVLNCVGTYFRWLLVFGSVPVRSVIMANCLYWSGIGSDDCQHWPVMPTQFISEAVYSGPSNVAPVVPVITFGQELELFLPPDPE